MSTDISEEFSRPLPNAANTCPFASTCTSWRSSSATGELPLPPPVLIDDDRPLATIRVEDDESAHRLVAVCDALGYQARREAAVEPHHTDERRDSWVYARMGYRCRLTTGEARVLPFVLAGDSIAEVAESLGIQVHNARAIVAAIYEKTGARTHAQLLRLAYGAAPLPVDSEAGRKLERVRELVRDLLQRSAYFNGELRELLELPADAGRLWDKSPKQWPEPASAEPNPIPVSPMPASGLEPKS